ncbi:hypothetical protein [Pseudomonas azerbaijanoccidentalis]
MWHRDGYFWPDDFPWAYDADFAVIQKLSVINAVPARTIILWLKCGYTAHKIGERTYRRLFQAFDTCEPSSQSFTHYISSYAAILPGNSTGAYKYCPACAETTGFVSVFFSLQFVHWCPWHHIKLKHLCAGCQHLPSFKPGPLGSLFGFHCPDCGYCLPRTEVLSKRSAHQDSLGYVKKHEAFIEYARTLKRLGVQLSLCCEKETALSCANIYLEDGDDGSNSVAFEWSGLAGWTKTIDLRSCASSGLSSSITCADSLLRLRDVYRQFCAFWQLRMLRRHACCLEAIAASVGQGMCETCLMGLAWRLFRMKFEACQVGDASPRLSESAEACLAPLAMSSIQLSQYFSCVFHTLLTRVYFWLRTTPKICFLVDNKHGFWDVFKHKDTDPEWHYLLVRHFIGARYSCFFDLPVSLQGMRELLHHQASLVIRITVRGASIDVHTNAPKSLLFGSLRPPIFIEL